jgi:phosphoribosylanthranilate isomerase
MTAVKITGIRTRAEAEHAVACGVASLGLRLDPGAVRSVDLDTARAIVDAVGARTLVVGVVAAAPLADVLAVREASRVACVELRGAVPPELLAPLLPHAYVALPLREAGVVEAARRYGGRYLLLERDPQDPRDAAAEDALWDVAAQLAAERRITLAGTLDAASVGAAIACVAPFCVDLALGDEADPTARIEAFVAAVREADARTLSADPAAPGRA